MNTASRRSDAPQGHLLRIVFLFLLAALCLVPPLVRSSVTPEGFRLFAYKAAFKYFTIDSNLLCGLAALCEAAALLFFPKEKDAPVWTSVFLLAGTVSVTITFLTVLFFLGPVYGYGSMYIGDELYMHLIAPVCAILLWVTLLRPCCRVPKKAAWLGALPLLIYAAYYLLNILCNGVSGNDWYGMARWGGAWYLPTGLLMALIALLTSLVLWRFGRGRKGDRA